MSLLFDAMTSSRGPVCWAVQANKHRDPVSIWIPMDVFAWQKRTTYRQFPMGIPRNVVEIRANGDAAHAGQERFFPKTQGGAYACPGLWDQAPSGLPLSPSGIAPPTPWQRF